ncbi:hypothetical protein D3C87_929070 [compost metagenome]
MHDPLFARTQQAGQALQQPVGRDIALGDTGQFQQEKLRWPEQKDRHNKGHAEAQETLPEPAHLALLADDHGGEISGHHKKSRHAEGGEHGAKRAQKRAGVKILDVPWQRMAVDEGGVIGNAKQHEESPERVPIMLVV